MGRPATKSVPITIPDLRAAERLAAERGATDWESLAAMLAEQTGKPITRRALKEAVRKGLQSGARPARRIAAKAVREAVELNAQLGQLAMPQPPT